MSRKMLIFEASVPAVEKGNRRWKKVLLSFLVVHSAVSKIHLLTGVGDIQKEHLCVSHVITLPKPMAKTLARSRVFKHEPFLQVFRQMVGYCMEHLQGIHSYSQCCNYCRLRAGCLLRSFWTVFVFAWWNSVLDFLVIILYCVLPGFEMGSNCFSLHIHLQNICRPNSEVPTCVPVTHRKSVGPLTE